jgi:hypothetical protein
MNSRQYYSVRLGKLQPNQIVTLDILKEQFLVVFNQLVSQGYFAEQFGYYCVDASGDIRGDGNNVEGELGVDIPGRMFIALKKRSLYPIDVNIANYSEDDFFDVVEFLYDHMSQGIDGTYHSFANCGMHYQTFNQYQGRMRFRETMNPMLRDYRDGFEIGENGEILILPDEGMSDLFAAEIPPVDAKNVTIKLELAKAKFRRRSSTWDERKDAIRELADVLEYLRADAKKHLSGADETELFNLANNFGIRHHNRKQKTAYDTPIWYSWMFYYYLATIHALLRLIERSQEQGL